MSKKKASDKEHQEKSQYHSSKERIDAIENTSVEEFFKQLDTTIDGLTTLQAQERSQKYGPNAIEEHKISPFKKFFTYFWGPIPWMIEIAAILSLIVQDFADFGIILVLLMVNSIIGFYQEFKADTAVEMLMKRLAINTKVKRDGTFKSIQANELVPGDIIHFRLGDLVPGDVKIITSENLELDQSALTGESLPVQREAGGIAFMSSIVKKGEGDALVVGTGSHTFFGETAQLVQQSKNVSHYQKSILKIGKFLIITTLMLVIIILIVSIARHQDIIQMLNFSLILTVASIPVALPAVISVTMAVGATILAKKQAIVTRLVAIEEMASMDVLCSDKTGTLTQNKMILGEPFLMPGVTEDDLIFDAALSSQVQDEDPIEKIIFDSLKGGIISLKEYSIVKYLPFDPSIKRTEATIQHDDKEMKVSKGAPQAILAICSDPDDIKEQIQAKVDEFASHGYRTLGVAKSSDGETWYFCGLLSLFDPPWDDAKTTIQAAKAKGIAVKMITGDNRAIALEIARKLDIGTKVVKAGDLFKDEYLHASLDLDSIDAFAEVFPEHKFDIVEMLQNQGHYVGMTGDGVNDAPALKKADVGIAVAGATDAARSAADLVLTESGISVIINALDESRKIFKRMTSYATYRIAETIRILAFMALSILIFQFYPITTIMIIFLALLNDIPIMMIAYDNAYSSNNPERWDMFKVLSIASLLGILGVISSFLLFYIAQLVFPGETDLIRTIIFLKMTVAGHITIYLTRSTDHHFWQRPLPSRRLFLAAELTQLVGTLFAVYGVFMKSIGWALAGVIWLYALAWFVFNNFVKVYAYKFFNGHVSKREKRTMNRLHRPLHAFGLPK